MYKSLLAAVLCVVMCRQCRALLWERGGRQTSCYGEGVEGADITLVVGVDRVKGGGQMGMHPTLSKLGRNYHHHKVAISSLLCPNL